MIASSLIDTIWKEKTKPEKIQETIQSAFCEIFRGAFDEIKEDDEEQLYNSYIYSGMNTHRLLSDNNLSSIKKNSSEIKNTQDNINMFYETDEERSKKWDNDFYEGERFINNLDIQYPVNELHQSLPVRHSVENVIDDDYEEYRANFNRELSIKIQEPLNYNDSEFDYVRLNNDEPLPRISRRRSIVSPHNFSTNENNLNHYNNQNVNGDEYKLKLTKKYVKSSDKSKMRNQELNNSQKLRKITMNQPLKCRKLGLLKNKVHNSTTDLNHKSFTAGKTHNFTATGTSFRKDNCFKVNKESRLEYNIPKVYKNGGTEIQKLTTKLHSRNKSNNSTIDKMTFTEGLNLRNEYQDFEINHALLDKKVL